MSLYFCRRCHLTFNHGSTGRMPLFCSNACRQANYRQQKSVTKCQLGVEDRLVLLRNAGS